MLGRTLRHLINRRFTSLDEIKLITRRGHSTIYRWLSGETHPSCDDVSDLLKNLRNLEARKFLLAAVTSQLPVVIEWINDDDKIVLHTNEDRTYAQTQTIALTIKALDCLADFFRHHHEIMHANSGELNANQFTVAAQLIDEAVRHLTNCKQLLAALVTKRKEAHVVVMPKTKRRAPARMTDAILR